MKTMRSAGALAGLVMLAGGVAADVIYSNNFSGTEFKAAGIGDVVIGNMVESGGRLVPTDSNTTTVGFRVDLTALGLATESAVPGVKLTITGKSPLAADGSSYLGLAFQDAGNFNVNGNGNPVIAINGSGTFRAAGGAGFAKNALPNTGSAVTGFSPGAEFTMSLVYHKNGTIDTWYDEVQVHDGQAIESTDAIELKHAVIAFRGLGIDDGANIDTFAIEVIPEPTTLGLLGISTAAIFLFRRGMMK